MDKIELPPGWKVIKLGEICIKRKTRNPSKKPEEIFTYPFGKLWMILLPLFPKNLLIFSLMMRRLILITTSMVLHKNNANSLR